MGHVGKNRNLMLTDDDFQEAAKKPVPTGEKKSGKKIANSGFPAFFPAAQTRNALHDIEEIEQATTTVS